MAGFLGGIFGGGQSSQSGQAGGAGGIGSLLTGIPMGIIGSAGARKAAGAQQAGQQAAFDFSKSMYGNALDFGAPYRTAGLEGLRNLQQFSAPEMQPFTGQFDQSQYRYTPQSQVPDVPSMYLNTQPYQFSGQNYQFSGQPYQQGLQDYNFSNQPYAFTPPSGQQVLQQDPGYQFRLQQGQKALEQSAAARGGLLSGGQAKAIDDYSQNLASQEYQNAYGRSLGQNQLAYQRQQEAAQRGLDVSQIGYQRGLGENQMAYQRGFGENQYNQQLAQLQNQDYWNRAMAAQGAQFGQGLQGAQFNAGLGLQGFQTGLQGYQANQQARQQRYNELSQLAGMGMQAQNQAANLTQGYVQQAAPWLAGVGSAQAGGIAGSTQQWLDAIQKMGEGVTQAGTFMAMA